MYLEPLRPLDCIGKSAGKLRELGIRRPGREAIEED
jgi:hypothetical protein